MSGANIIKHSAQQLCANEDAHQTKADPKNHQPHAFTNDQPQHVNSLSSKCETNSNLMGAFCDGVTHHSKNPTGGKEECDPREQSNENAMEARLRDRGIYVIRKTAHTKDRHAFVELVHGAIEGRSQSVWISIGSDHPQSVSQLLP